MTALKCMGCVVLLCVGLTVPVSAQTTDELYQQQLEAGGATHLRDSVPQDSLRLMDELGVGDLQEFHPPTLNEVLALLGELLGSVAGAPVAACGTVLGTVVLYAWVDGMRHTLRSDDSAVVFGSICALAACGAVMLPLADVIRDVSRAMDSVSVFMTGFIPVYGSILVGGGFSGTATGFQTTVLASAEVLSYLAGFVIVPLLTVSLAMGLTGTLTPDLKLGRIGSLTGKVATWILTFGMVIFSGVLSMQSLVGGAADRLTDKALRFSVSHLVPVVGGSVGEAFSTVRGCLRLLRSTVGCFGVVATALIVLPPLLSCVVWNVMLTVSETAADIFGLSTFSELLKTSRGVVKCLIGVLTVSGLLLTVSLTVISLALGGVT